MTGACYCKGRTGGGRPRGEDDDIGASNRASRRRANAASAKSLIRKEARGSDGRSPIRRTRSTGDEKTPDEPSGPIAAQPPSRDLILSPETSTALENAERIASDARMRLAEMCTTSGAGSAPRNGSTCPDYLPLDDETEELLYIRELVASRFQEADHPSGPEMADGIASSRRLDLLAPKFRMSRRRRVDLGAHLERGSDERRERASPQDSSRDEGKRCEATIQGDDQARVRRRTPASSSSRSERVRDSVCRIQTGPPVHIGGELTRQNLEAVHISPEPLSNTGTYLLRHRSVADDKFRANNKPEAAVSPDTSRRDKRGRLIVAEVATETANAAENVNSRDGDGNGRTGSEEPRDRVDGKETRTREGVSRDVDNATSRTANGVALDFDSAEEKSANASSGENDAAESRRAKAGRALAKKTGENIPDQPQDEVDVASKIQAEERGDRSEPPETAGDVSRKAAFRQSSSARCRTTTGSPRSHGAIDERPSIAFHRRDGQDVLLYDVSFEQTGEASAIHFEAEGDPSEVELYRPHFEDFDSVLLSNDRKIERVVRATKTLSKLLTRMEFSEYQQKGHPSSVHRSTRRGEEPAEAKRKPSAAVGNRESGTSASNTAAASHLSIAEIAELKSRGASTSASASDARSSAFASETCDRSGRSGHSVVSSARPARSMSDEEGPRRRRTAEARLPSESSSLDKSDLMPFSNLPPALSSTRTDTQASRHRRERIAEAEPQRSTTDKSESHPEDGFSGHESLGEVFARILRGLKDEAADRFVAYVLQDEKQSIERKVATALKESAIASTTVEKLLDRLREVDSAVRPTETLGVLKNILTNVRRNHREEGDKGEEAVGHLSARPARTVVSASEAGVQVELLQLAVESHQDLEDREERLSDRPGRGEAHENVRSALNSRAESVAKSVAESESLKRMSNTREDPGRTTDSSARFSSARTVSMRLIEEREARVDDSANVVSKDAEGDTGEKRGEDEPSAARDNEGSASSERNYAVEEDVARATIVTANRAVDEEGSTKTTDGETRDVAPSVSDAGSAPPAFPVVAAGKDERVLQSDAIDNSRSSKVASTGKEEQKEDAARSLTPIGTPNRNVESPHPPSWKDVAALPTDEGLINPLRNSCSADSLRDCVSLRTSPSAKNGSLPVGEVEPSASKTSLDVAAKDKLTDASYAREARGESTTTMTAETRSRADEELEVDERKSSRSDEQQRPTAATSRKSNLVSSSVNSTLLDHDGGSSCDALDASAKKIGTLTSTESSHSEGELYMPSSCSYSLGEVRILEKCDVVADSILDRDSSVTILVTRSMLTSLNDDNDDDDDDSVTQSPQESSGRV